MGLMQSAKLSIGNAVIYISLVLFKQNGKYLSILALREILFFLIPIIYNVYSSSKGRTPLSIQK